MELATPFTCTIRQGQNDPVPLTGQKKGSFEILDVKPVQEKSGEPEKTFELLLVAYDTGSYDLAALFSIGKYADIPIMVTITEPTAEKISSYAPPKELAFPSAGSSTLQWLPFLLAALFAGLLVWYFRTRKKTLTIVPSGSKLSAMELLQQVKKSWASGELNSVEFGDGLVSSLQAQYGVPVKRSTRQLAKAIRKQHVPVDYQNIELALIQTDAWRFGKQVASASQGMNAIQSLETLFKSISKKPDTES